MFRFHQAFLSIAGLTAILHLSGLVFFRSCRYEAFSQKIQAWDESRLTNSCSQRRLALEGPPQCYCRGVAARPPLLVFGTLFNLSRYPFQPFRAVTPFSNGRVLFVGHEMN